MTQQEVEYYYNRLMTNQLCHIRIDAVNPTVIWFEMNNDADILVTLETVDTPNGYSYDIELGTIDLTKKTSTVNIENNMIREDITPLIERLLTYG